MENRQESGLERFFAANGTEQAAGAHHPFRLDGEEGAWLVREGTLDLFSVRRAEGMGQGRRERVVPVGAEAQKALRHYLQARADLPGHASQPLRQPVAVQRPQQLRSWVREGGVDLILIETVFDTLNAKAAGYAVEEVFDEVLRSSLL